MQQKRLDYLLSRRDILLSGIGLQRAVNPPTARCVSSAARLPSAAGPCCVSSAHRHPCLPPL